MKFFYPEDIAKLMGKI